MIWLSGSSIFLSCFRNLLRLAFMRCFGWMDAQKGLPFCQVNICFDDAGIMKGIFL